MSLFGSMKLPKKYKTKIVDLTKCILSENNSLDHIKLNMLIKDFHNSFDVGISIVKKDDISSIIKDGLLLSNMIRYENEIVSIKTDKYCSIVKHIELKNGDFLRVSTYCKTEKAKTFYDISSEIFIVITKEFSNFVKEYKTISMYEILTDNEIEYLSMLFRYCKSTSTFDDLFHNVYDTIINGTITLDIALVNKVDDSKLDKLNYYEKDTKVYSIVKRDNLYYKVEITSNMNLTDSLVVEFINKIKNNIIK